MFFSFNYFIYNLDKQVFLYYSKFQTYLNWAPKYEQLTYDALKINM